MSWLNKLPNSVRSASGLEWKLWRKLPLILLVGTALPLAAAVALHLSTDTQNGCVVVMVMKGPGYVADGMEVSHSDKPRRIAEGQEP